MVKESRFEGEQCQTQPHGNILEVVEIHTNENSGEGALERKMEEAETRPGGGCSREA